MPDLLDGRGRALNTPALLSNKLGTVSQQDIELNFTILMIVLIKFFQSTRKNFEGQDAIALNKNRKSLKEVTGIKIKTLKIGSICPSNQ